MTDPGLNNLLKWGIKNSSASKVSDGQPISDAVQDKSQGIDQAALAQLLGGPSDADRMRESMAAVQSPDVSLDNKCIAFDNLEQLIENIDNANNMESLGLWMPLIEQLDNGENELRLLAAWCVGTAVQNNPRAQDRCLVVGAIPKLVRLALEDANLAVRKKAVFALSSEVRNYQPGLDEALKYLPAEYKSQGEYDASDMEAVDSITNRLRAAIQSES